MTNCIITIYAGLMNFEPNSQDFVFRYLIDVDNFGNVNFIEEEKTQRDGKKLIWSLWERIKGN